MPQNGQIDYVEFTAGDITKAKEFYGRVFGWEFQDYGPDYASFSAGRMASGMLAALAAK